MNIPPKENTFRRKIKTREQLRKAIGLRPRVNKVIMCHGTFDLVHPGHIRHLMYAKDHADVLVASLTSDSHINKANFRPFVPQDLRAMNLAALECRASVWSSARDYIHALSDGGKAKDARATLAGALTGDRKLKTEGKLDQAAGKVKDVVEKVAV